MKIPRWTLRAAALVLSLATGAMPLAAQGVTTGGIGGTVTGAQGALIEGAQITVTNRSTGFTASGRTRSNGSYLIQGLEVGGAYSVFVRQLGMEPQTKDGIRVTLSQVTRVDFQLATAAQVLAGVTTTGERGGALIAPSRTGIGTTITDTMVSRLPSLNRDFVDFARLTPQIAVVPGSGISGGGTNNRFNSIQIDGVSESDLFGLGSTGTPGGGVSAKSISVESVKEYQVLLSPFDVRQGNFVGALINAVTKSGTNTLSGSAYGFLRDQQITRTQDYLSAFNQKQYGFSLGGPIVKDKIFFFVNPEFQTQTQPTPGPFIGSVDATITQAQVDQVNAALAPYGIAGGTGAIIPQENPLTNVFGRLDFNLPMSSRGRISLNYSDGERTNFSRSTSGDFRLTSNAYDFASKKYSTVGQIFSNWSSGASNELSVGYVTIDDYRSVPQVAPQITVSVPRNGGGSAVPVVAGTERSSQGNSLYQTILDIGDNFSLPIGSHNITVGTKNFFYYSDNLFAQDRYGTWSFQSLDSLNGTCALCGGAPQASSYTVRVPIGDQATAKFHSATYGLFIQDQWKVRPTMNLLVGLRADIPVFKDKPPFNQAFFTEYDTLTGTRSIGGGRRTDVLPSGNIDWSPRVGFNWDVTGDETNQFRAGSGVFSGPPAYVWLSNAFGNSGVSGYPALTCNSATNPTLRPPAFTQANVDSPPQACAGPTGQTAALGSAINLLNEDLHFPQSWKTTMGFDHKFSGQGRFGDMLRDIVGTVEAQYTKGLYTPFYSNLALLEPDPTVAANINSQGRLMYGTLSATGSGTAPNRRTGRTEVYDVTNSSGDYSYQLTAGLTKRYATRWEGALFYTFTQSFDIQSTGNSTAGSNFGLGRILSGGSLLDKSDLQHSRWEIPHRVVANGTYTFPWRTAVTAIWTGNSGQRFTYYHTTDENADGQANDAVYIPNDAHDVNEIRFAATTGSNARSIAEQQDAYDAFIESVPCLDRQRGQIMTRNSCRAPWQNVVDVSLRQPFKTVRGQNFSVQLDIFNFANLLNDQWGIIREAGDPGFPGQRLLTRVSSATVGGVITPTYTMVNTEQPFYTIRNIQSNYRMQLSMRYSF
jgi:hypothetical protein